MEENKGSGPPRQPQKKGLRCKTSSLQIFRKEAWMGQPERSGIALIASSPGPPMPPPADADARVALFAPPMKGPSLECWACPRRPRHGAHWLSKQLEATQAQTEAPMTAPSASTAVETAGRRMLFAYETKLQARYPCSTTPRRQETDKGTRY